MDCVGILLGANPALSIPAQDVGIKREKRRRERVREQLIPPSFSTSVVTIQSVRLRLPT